MDVLGDHRFCVNLHSSPLSGWNEDEQINRIAEPALSQLFTLWGKNAQVFLGFSFVFRHGKMFAEARADAGSGRAECLRGKSGKSQIQA